MKYYNLKPKDDLNIDGYKEALDNVFEDPSINNVAISGTYSSGKSSIIDSYEKIEHKDFIHISLAHFNATRKTDTSEKPYNEEILEAKIINQLIHQIPVGKIRLSRFNIKRYEINERVSIIKVVLNIFSIFFAVGIPILIYLSVVNSKLASRMRILIILKKNDLFFNICIIVELILIFYLCICIFIFFKTHKGIAKLNINGNGIELYDKEDSSYFDKYLDEILYLFIRSGQDAIIFEDIDRFNNIELFAKLREINNILNEKCQRESKNDKKSIKFIYLLRDDIFKNKERVKFFDLIIPVVPVINTQNSYDMMIGYIRDINSAIDEHNNALATGDNKHKQDKISISDDLLHGLSLYIDDLRILKNIFNEFEIYYVNLNKDGNELKQDKLLAMITYKNLFPEDYANLLFNKGFVFSICNQRDKLIQLNTEKLNERSEELQSYIKANEQAIINNEQYIKILDDHFRYSSYRSEYEQWNNDKEAYNKAIEYLKDVDKINNEIKKIDEEIQRISEYSLRDLIENCSIDKLINDFEYDFFDFKSGYHDEINKKKFNYILSIRNNHYFGLLKYLLIDGYIDETYDDYMSYFYPNSLSIRDKNFCRNVKERRDMDLAYHLDHPKLIIQNLNQRDFRKPQALNYELFLYMIRYQQAYDQYLNIIFEELRKQYKLEFFDGIFTFINEDEKNKENNIRNITQSIMHYWNTFYQDMSNNPHGHRAFTIMLSYHTLQYCDQKTLIDVNKNNCLTDLIENGQSYLNDDRLDEFMRANLSKISESLIYLKVKFKKIDGRKANEDLLRDVYENDLYEFIQDNVQLMTNKFLDSYGFQMKQLMTFIYKYPEEYLSGYFNDNKNEFFEIYLQFDLDAIDDESEAIVNTLNDDELDDEAKKLYIAKISKKVEMLEDISEDSYKSLLLKDEKVHYSADNILCYYGVFGLDDSLIDFINSDPTELDFKDSDSFVKKCIACNKLSNSKYEQIIHYSKAYDVFDITTLEKDKINILINNDKIIMNENNLDFIRSKYAKHTIPFIETNIEEYEQLVSPTNYDQDEISELLDSDNVSEEAKKNILSTTGYLMDHLNNKFSDTFKVFVIEHNLEIDSNSTYLKDEYLDYSTMVKDAFVRKIIECLKKGRINDDCLTTLFPDEFVDDFIRVHQNLDIEKQLNRNKLISLLDANISKFNAEQIQSYLMFLKLNKIVNNLNGGNKKIDKTNENTRVLQILKDNGIIGPFELSADGIHYRKLKVNKKLYKDRK